MDRQRKLYQYDFEEFLRCRMLQLNWEYGTITFVLWRDPFFGLRIYYRPKEPVSFEHV